MATRLRAPWPPGPILRASGWIWVSGDIAKGRRERWVPIIADLETVIDEIHMHVATDEYVLPAQRWRDPGSCTSRIDLEKRPCSPQALYRLVGRVGERAGIAARVHSHLLRHAFGDHIARHAGMRNAQFLLGHADVGTTESYVGRPTLDELARAVAGLRSARSNERSPPPRFESQSRL